MQPAPVEATKPGGQAAAELAADRGHRRAGERAPGRLSLSKGDRVMVTGRLRQRTWETPEGDKRSVAEIEADEVGASLKFATATVERAQERGPSDRSQGRERQAERGGDLSEPPPL
jgi:hypothetical protein